MFKLVKSVWQTFYQSLAKNKDVQLFIKQHPRLVAFFHQRLHFRKFTGLALTLLALLFLYLLFSFGGITRSILASDPIALADVRISNLLATFRNPVLAQIFFKITLLANWQMIVVSSLCLAAILWLKQKKEFLIGFIVSLLGSAVFSYLGKLLIHRPRPQVGVLEFSSYAFPSSHAALAVALFGFISYYLFRFSTKYSRKVLAILFFGFLIILIGFSRVYLGFHFISDVIGGFYLGLLWLVIAIIIAERLYDQRKNKKNQNKIIARKFWSAILISVIILFYIGLAFFYQPEFKFPEPAVIVQSQTTNALDLFSGADALPRFTETPTAQTQEPISFIILAKDNDAVINIFKQSGWYLADPPGIKQTYHLIKASLLNQQYLSAPMTPSFWNAQVHDFGFEKPTAEQTVRQRHHARVWQTHIKLADGNQIYVATASFDLGIKYFVTHKIDPDIDQEREFIFNDLNNTGQLLNYEKVQFISSELGQNFSGDLFYTDGQAYIFQIK